LKKPVRVSSLPERSSKKSGAQAGHDGKTLRQVAEPDNVIAHHPPACSGCGEALTPNPSADYAARQVFDLPEPQPLVVTGRRAFSCRCEACGATIRAAFPEGVRAPVQHGARIAAMSRNCAGRLHGFVEMLRHLVASAPVKHMDETDFRIGGKTRGCPGEC
jgi:transposase